MEDSIASAREVTYDPEGDILCIDFVGGPYEAGGAEETQDKDVILHYDTDGRLAEIEVYRASERVSGPPPGGRESARDREPKIRRLHADDFKQEQDHRRRPGAEQTGLDELGPGK